MHTCTAHPPTDTPTQANADGADEVSAADDDYHSDSVHHHWPSIFDFLLSHPCSFLFPFEIARASNVLGVVLLRMTRV